ncbi:helix-turn-helix domain-containing protein [Streptomyces chartreusis]|uniref:helix-turn-helix transcriptional regulator n=1 Tax=Streptomyces TaxID=1883 RepID=UPI002E8186CE|nr:helix-turn-helix transcriptional regulator [Streptomyces chartreusis]WUB18302.1 helix-turn-helix domain-containing protein [Streptomyces chartreusis]
MLTQPSFGRRLRQLRQQQGKTQADLAGPGMSTAYLSRLESGDRPPTTRVLEYLAQRLHVPGTAFEESEPVGLVDVLAAVLVPSETDSLALRKKLQSALEHAPDVDPALRWQAHAHLARLLEDEGHREAERSALVALNALSDELGHASLRLHSRFRLARCLRALGEAEPARTAAREGLDLAAHAGLAGAEVVRCQILLASVTAELGDLAEAARLSGLACEALATTAGPVAAEAFWSAATIATRQGRHHESAELLQHALSVLDSRDDLTLWMRLRLATAALALQMLPPDLNRADTCLSQAQPAVDLIGKVLHVQEYTFLRAQLAYASGDIERAAELCDEVDRAGTRLTFRDRTRMAMLREQIRAGQGDHDAVRRLQELAAEAQTHGMLDLATEVWRAAAQAR